MRLPLPRRPLLQHLQGNTNHIINHLRTTPLPIVPVNSPTVEAGEVEVSMITARVRAIIPSSRTTHLRPLLGITALRKQVPIGKVRPRLPTILLSRVFPIMLPLRTLLATVLKRILLQRGKDINLNILMRL